MEILHRISKTDLARKTHEILRNIQRGQMAIIESHGQAEAALMDIIDYRILRAVASYSASPHVDKHVAANFVDEQDRYNQVLFAYLSEAISLGRAAELLDLSAIDLRFRFIHLDLPLRTGPVTVDEIEEDIRQANTWERQK